MTQNDQYKIIHLPREGWDTGELPRLGSTVDPSKREGITVHHTVTKDSDHTPNVWEDRDSIIEHMRFLQKLQTEKVRDLDVFYNFVIFLLRDSEYVVFAEGRGLYRKATHLANANTKNIGIAFAGNFEKSEPKELRKCLVDNRQISHWVRSIRYLGFDIKEVFGHGQVSNTLCPGKAISNFIWAI